jgi:hypothetical protein
MWSFKSNRPDQHNFQAIEKLDKHQNKNLTDQLYQRFYMGIKGGQ